MNIFFLSSFVLRHDSDSKVLKVVVVLLSHLVRVRILADVLLGVNVEALGVAGVPDRRQDGTRELAAVNGVPVDALEEGVLLDPRRAATDVTEPAGAVDGAELSNDVLCVGRDWWVLREDDGLFDDSVVGR